MKQLISVLLTIFLLAAFSGCNSGAGSSVSSSVPELPTSSETPTTSTISQPPETLEPESSQTDIKPAETLEPEGNEEQKILVAYYTWAENAVQDGIDAVASASVKSPGNVAPLATWVSEGTGGELFSIRVEELYPNGWDDCLSRANQEKADNARPALSAKVENLEDYDTVFLGYPNWWYSCPMAILSFLEENDLSGKQVYLFCSHGTGGLASSVRDITAAMPESAVVAESVFHVYQDETASSQDDLESWLNELGY